MPTLRSAARWLNAHTPAAARRLVARLNRRRHGGRSARAAWEAGIQGEVAHWREVFQTDPAHVAWLSDPDGLVGADTLLGEVLEDVVVESPSVLDVGSGPMTPLGHVFHGRRLRITAIDPLADTYNELLDDLGIDPPVRTVPGDGETLREQFGAGSFDIAIATNTLDHTYEPVLVVESMLEVVRPGGLVLLDHHRNEAENRLYRGLHQWNLDERDGDLVVWNPDERVDLSQRLAQRATVRAYRRGSRVRAVLTKLPA